MYEYISGTVAEATPAYAVIDAGGVGYYLHISLETFSAVEHAQNARLYVHYIVREDAQILYGFATKVEREFFRHLISVSGVGGNTARMILSTYSPRELQGIITSGNAVLLKNVKGLGYVSEDGTSSVFTLNPALQKQLDALAAQHPEVCQRKARGEAGGVTYQVRGAALAIQPVRGTDLLW